MSGKHLRLHHLSKAEQQLWNSFEKADFYKFLAGEKDCIPEFKFNWISPEALTVRWPAPPAVQAPAAQPQIPPEVPAPPDQPLPDEAAPPVLPEVPPIDAPPAQTQNKLPIPVSDRVWRDQKPVDYQELLKHRYYEKMQIVKKKSSSGCHQTSTRGFLTKTREPLHVGVIAMNLLFLFAFFIQMQYSTAHTKPPILIDSEFSQPQGLQLRFRPMGKFAASTFTSHIRISFNYSSLIGLQQKLNDRLDNFFNVLNHWNFTLPDLDIATLKSTFQLYKGKTNGIFKLFHDLLTSLPNVHEHHR